MKILSILYLNSVLIFGLCHAEAMPTKSNLLKQSNKCLNESQKRICKKLIIQLEKLQFLASKQNRLKCQSSLLGLQTILVEAHFLKNTRESDYGIMTSYVIKNC